MEIIFHDTLFSKGIQRIRKLALNTLILIATRISLTVINCVFNTLSRKQF